MTDVREKIEGALGVILAEYELMMRGEEPRVSITIKKILAIPELLIKDDDQSLPNVRNAVNKSYNDYMLGQEDMLKPDKNGSVWVKVRGK